MKQSKVVSALVQLQSEPAFPWLGMTFLCLGMLAHSVVFTSPLPYVAFMVVDFKMTDSLGNGAHGSCVLKILNSPLSFF